MKLSLSLILSLVIILLVETKGKWEWCVDYITEEDNEQAFLTSLKREEEGFFIVYQTT